MATPACEASELRNPNCSSGTGSPPRFSPIESTPITSPGITRGIQICPPRRSRSFAPKISGNLGLPRRSTTEKGSPATSRRQRMPSSSGKEMSTTSSGRPSDRATLRQQASASCRRRAIFSARVRSLHMAINRRHSASTCSSSCNASPAFSRALRSKIR